MKNYAHVDADCFYVSCERLRDPFLEGKPVAVLGNQGACVIARSYEMKAQGVKVAMPIWQAKKLSPEGVFIKRDFRWYGVLSRAMQEIMHEFSDTVEYYSVDESFLDLGPRSEALPELARRIQERMAYATGLPVSVGMGPTRTLCKLASKLNKPLGTLVIDEENRESILASTPVEEVNGIGRKLVERAHLYGIRSALDLARMKRKKVKQIFHKPGEVIWYELNGQPVLTVKNEQSERKIVSRGGSIWGHYRDPAYIWGFIVRNLERFMTALWNEEMEVARLTLILRRSDGTSDVQTTPLPDYTQDQKVLLKTLRVLFEKAYKKGPTYSRVHIVGQPIRYCCRKQLNLFEVVSPKVQRMAKLKQEVNERFGLFTLRSASSEYASEVFKDKVSDFEITDIPGKQLF
jgi:DNA polymerase V